MSILPKWSNNGLSEIASAMNSTQTTLTLLLDTGSRFPVDSFPLRIWNNTVFANPIDDPNNEIVFCTSRSGDVLTITRAQEGTVGATHAAGDSVALMITQKFRDDLESKFGLVKLDGGTVSAASTLDIVMTAHTAFKNKLLVFNNFVPATDAAVLWMRVSTDGGTTFDAGASAYSTAAKAHTSGNVAGDYGEGAAQIKLTGGNSDNAASSGGISGRIYMYSTTAAVKGIFAFETGTVNSDLSAFWHTSGHSWRNAAQDTDAVRLLFSSGNIASGDWALYGFN